MPEQIGRYEIKEELGRGGMATVYLAYDPRFRRQVAIKVLPPQFTHDPKFLDRFATEAQTIATLEHPAIVPVHDFGEHESSPYLVMRYMAGGSLRERMRGEPLPLDQITAVLERLAPALDLAHVKGIVHRDLKPANVLFDEQGNPYLADFGIARLAEATQTMTVIGTPAYMSPEQVQGKEKLDGRSDIYALGTMLYELLTGQQPYTAETPTGQMMAHVLEPIPDIVAANPGLPPGAQRFINKAMAKDREDRFASAAELTTALAELSAATGNEAVAPAPEDPGYAETADFPPDSEEEESKTKEIGAAATVVEPLLSVSAGMEDEELVAEPEEIPLLEPEMVPPVEQKRGRLPGWIWWIAALLLLAVIIFGMRSFLDSGSLLDLGPAASEFGAASGEIATPAEATATAKPEPSEQAVVVEPPQEEPDLEQEREPEPTGTFLERALAGEFSGGHVSLLSSHNFEDGGAMIDTLRPFQEATGIAVEYVEIDDFNEQLNARVEAGEPPDIARIFNPVLLAKFAREGQAQDLREFLPEEQLLEAYSPPWLEAMEMQGAHDHPIIAGLWVNAIPESIVWYPRTAFEEAGYEVPANWDELIALSEQMVADGRTPWCIGIEMGAGTGMIATDWIENILLRTTPLEIYDRWVTGEHLFASPEIIHAVDLMTQIWFNEAFVFGGVGAITEIPFDESPQPMFADPPGCWLHLQGPYIRASFGPDRRPGVDYDFFPLPPVDEAFGNPLLVSGDMMAMFTDSPEARALMDYLAGADGLESWVRSGQGISPNRLVNLDWYPTDVDRRLAQMSQDVSAVRFDGSNQMPREVGAGPFWGGMTAYVRGEANLETVLHELDEAWDSVAAVRPARPPAPTDPDADCHDEDIFCIGLVVAGPVEDNAFNQATWEGVLRAARQLDARADFMETAGPADYEQGIDILANDGFDIIVTVGFTFAEATQEAAARHPDLRFIGVDQFQEMAVDNLAGLIFAEDQAGFMAGALAGLISEKGIAGAVLGSELVPPIVAFRVGYENGARYTNPGIDLLITYHPGELGVAFRDPEWGTITARQTLDQGADVIFAAAGETGDAALVEVAGDPGAYCIGVDVDQWYTVPDARPCLVSSAVKDIAPAIEELLIMAYGNELSGGNHYGPVSLAPFHDFGDRLSPEIKGELEAIAIGLAEGAIDTGYEH